MKKIIVTLFALFAIAPNAYAGDADIDFSLAASYAQPQFEDLSRQLGSAIAYRQAAPAETLGLLGFDVGIEISQTKIDEDKSFWSDIAPDMPGSLYVPKLRVQKGLPFISMDIGASYAKIPESDIELMGAELKYSLLDGGVMTPAVAVRGSYSTLTGIDDLDLSTYGVDLSVSKGFLMFTPYAGVGQTWIKSKYTGSGLTLDSESISETKYFAGVRVALAILMFTFDVEQSDITTYTGRFSIGF